MNMSLNITCLSDTHNKHHYLTIPEADVLLHAGDATMIGTKKELESFVQWLAKQPAAHKIWVAGNHDWGMETTQSAYDHWAFRRRRSDQIVVDEVRTHILKLCEEYRITYLNNSGVTIDGVNFWGSPDQPAFCGWGFNRSSQFLQEHWKTVPDDTNVLITHAPAYGILDALEDGEMVGDVALLKRINTLPNLKLHLAGHIHPGYGTVEVAGVTHVNASILDDSYQIRNKPIELELK